MRFTSHMADELMPLRPIMRSWSRADLDPAHAVRLEPCFNRTLFQFRNVPMTDDLEIVHRQVRVQSHQTKLAALATGKSNGHFGRFVFAGRWKIPEHDVAPASISGGQGFYFRGRPRSEEHTSELQSHVNLVCRL